MIWVYWFSGVALALLWFIAVFRAVIHRPAMADITRSEWMPPDPAVLPSLAIVVPARNEEADLPEAMRSLLDLHYPRYQIVAVNDRSTDNTGQIMETFAAKAPPGKLQLIHVRELPPRWLGKTHAMWLAAQTSDSEWILFTDADCVFHPDSLARALHYATKQNLDHLVLFPTGHLKTWGEQIMISLPHIMSHFVFRYWKIRDPNARDYIGVGAFNLVKRQAYQTVGTFEKLRLEVVDDLMLGRAIKKADLRQDVVIGPDLVRLRWAAGAAGVIANLEKNLFAFMGYRLSLVLATCVALFAVAIWPFAGLFLAPGWSRLSFALAVGIIAFAYYHTSRYTKIQPLFFLACPVSALLFIFATVRSAFVAMRDSAITWRGTKYPLEELRKGSG